ncbi:MAG: hypothetical protein A2V98_20375 [Planctomycetes bacterium RBG_16_64_12]|nr:MAG: hypothetical protein A2V98_20375 [Planctomycetes bacterium RBG_16_64_12]HLA84579.1 twin-arginine translocation signal domain-containing protein [Thermoguttaceae bacterium]
MQQQQTTRRQFLKQSAVATSASALAGRLAGAQANEVDRSITVKPPTGVRQVDVLYDAAAYSAFPHVVRLNGHELLMAFRQAPRQERVRHTHPRSVITVRSRKELGRHILAPASRTE